MQLRFRVDGAGAETGWMVRAPFQGFRDVLQGGMVLAILDDCMWYAAYARGGVTLTAEATVRYRAKVAVGEQVTGHGRVLAQRGRLWTCSAELVRAQSGDVLATAEDKFLAVPEGQLHELVAGARVHELPDEPYT
jgi:acyl-coenzyme A thioesterase PaaI-like protein